MIQIRNRLQDLKKLNNSSNDVRNDDIIDSDQEPDIQCKVYTGPVGNLLKKYLYIRNGLKELETHLMNMKSMVTAQHINNFKQKEFNKMRSESIKIGNDIIKKLKKLESSLPNENDFITIARMKRLLYYGFFQQYVILWTKNEQFLMDFEQNLRKKLQIQSQILNCNLTAEDIEILIENRNTNLFMSNILQDTETERKTLREIQARFEDLKKLEKSIAEVHNLFISLQALVAVQGDTIQCIETHFNATRHYVEEATNHLRVAEQMKKSKFYELRCCFF